MKLVILAGGLGTRISEETISRPKPMVEIGGKPIIWHIMKMYSYYGINDFIICCGYKGYFIKEYFLNYALHTSDVTFNLKEKTQEIHSSNTEPWKITLVETGEKTMTGGRLKRVKEYLNDDTFCFTYGDGLSDVNISELISFHNKHGKLATITAVQPPARFGVIKTKYDKVTGFSEKLQSNEELINGGFFVLSPKVINLINDDDTIWEEDTLKKLVEKEELKAFKHLGFWQPMDTLREKNLLESLWNANNAPWKKWKE